MTMMMFLPVVLAIVGMLPLSPDRSLLPSPAPPIRFLSLLVYELLGGFVVDVYQHLNTARRFSAAVQHVAT